MSIGPFTNSLIVTRIFFVIDCYIQLKSANTTNCPFCGNTTFTAIYIEKKPSFQQSTSSKSVDAIKAGRDDEEKSAASGTSISTSSENAIKTQAVSPDLSTKSLPNSRSSPMYDIKASKTDREALEAQIRNQRLQFHQEDYASEYQSYTSYSSSAHRYQRDRRSDPYGSNNRSYSYRNSREMRERDSSGSRFSQTNRRRSTGSDGFRRHEVLEPANSQSSQLSSGSRGHHQDDDDDNETDNPFLTSIQNLLEATHMDEISSFEQLEEIMLLEVSLKRVLFYEVPMYLIDVFMVLVSR